MKKLNLAGIIACMAVSLFFCCKEEQNTQQKEPDAISIPSNKVSTMATLTNTATQQETGFENGTIDPFTVCTTQNPNYGQPFTKNGSKCMKFYWTQTGYDGTRMDKGAEACTSLNFYKDGWFGFHFYLPATGYPYDKETAIGQIFAENGCSSWAALLIVRNNNLYLQYRPACVNPTEVLISTNIQRDAWKPVILHFVASHNNAGLIEVWYAGAGKSSPTYRAANINFAWGVWAGDILNSTVADNMIKLKFGMYCYDDANYVTDESRVIYFDNVSMLMGNPTNAWETVNPNM